MTDEDEDLIASGRAVELLEVWQGLFRGSRLVKAGAAPSCTGALTTLSYLQTYPSHLNSASEVNRNMSASSTGLT